MCLKICVRRTDQVHSFMRSKQVMIELLMSAFLRTIYRSAVYGSCAQVCVLFYCNRLAKKIRNREKSDSF